MGGLLLKKIRKLAKNFVLVLKELGKGAGYALQH